jgi:uncharacterized iron-regulated membrane protein
MLHYILVYLSRQRCDKESATGYDLFRERFHGITRQGQYTKMNRWMRKLHRWGALICGLPLLLVIVTGLLLQLKKQLTWVQPATQLGSVKQPELSFDQILQATKGVPQAGVNTWDDIVRLDIQPKKGIAKVQCKNQWELQVDLGNQSILSSAYRRSDFIESLHDGSFLTDWGKLGIFLPSGLLLLSLWFTGAWLWWLPIQSKLKKKRREAAN